MSGLAVPVRPCETMTDVRREIDRVDRAVVALLVERLGYIERAGHIKGRRNEVRDEDRKADVLSKVRRHAEALGGDAELIAAVYEQLVERSIAKEFTVYDAQAKASPSS